jgi:hypothetical protein
MLHFKKKSKKFQIFVGVVDDITQLLYSSCKLFIKGNLSPVSQKVVNRKLGRTTVFTIYDRFTKLTDFRYTTFFGRKLPTGSEQL